MEKGEEESNWSEAVEDLVTSGDTEGAISLLETLVSKLETLDSPSESSHLQLASALFELAELYSSKGFSLKADELRSRASLIRHQPFSSRDAVTVKDSKKDPVLLPHVALPSSGSACDGSSSNGQFGESIKPPDGVPSTGSFDDDWESIADHTTDELLSSQCLPGVSNISLEDTELQKPKWRGRGTFSYRKNELYSDHQSDKPVNNDIYDDDDLHHNSERSTEARYSKYGTRHVLVLSDFPPSTRTMELEKLFEGFKDHEFVIRWVNDTTALAVFRTPSVALEARNNIQCTFRVRVLEEEDILLSSISSKDLEPPRQRPQTSARTAQRLIAQVMGVKLPSGSREFKNQEEARRNRIVTRQKLRDDAWGPD